MPISWLDKANDLSHILDRNQLQSNPLSPEQLNYIQENILIPFKLTITSLQKDIFNNERSIDKSLCFLVLEACILINTNKGESDINELFLNVIDSLTLPGDKNWNWQLDSKKNRIEEHYYYRLRVMCALLYVTDQKEIEIKRELLLDILAAMSWHAHPKLPWTSKMNSRLITELIGKFMNLKEIIHTLIPDYIKLKLKPELLTLSSRKNVNSINNSLSNTRLTPAGYSYKLHKKESGLLYGGMKPKLGFGGTYKEADEEEQRQNWKSSSKVRSLSMVWFTIFIISDNEYLSEYWPICTSFILNIIEDHEPLIKAQSCELLNYFMTKIETNDYRNHIFLKTGLSELMLESCTTCLSYLPTLTPADQSQCLLYVAYPATLKLCDLKSKKEGNSICFVELINTNILSSITHVHDRAGKNSLYPILILLFNQLDAVIRLFLGVKVLLCFSRINFTLNQLMISPYVIDAGTEGLDCIKSILHVQRSTFQQLDGLQDEASIKLILHYKYDFLAAWSVLQKRLLTNCSKHSIQDILDLCNVNYRFLKRFCLLCGRSEMDMLEADIQEIHSTNSILSICFT